MPMSDKSLEIVGSAPTPKKHDLPRFMPKRQKPLLFMVLGAAAINAFTRGYDTMMMAGLIAVPQFSEYFNTTPTKIGLLNASLWIGSISSCFIMQWLADYLGRKRTIFWASALSFIGVALQSASTSNIGMFVFARILLGFCTQLTGAASPLILAEVAPTQKRGFLCGLFFCFFNAGAIIATGVTYGTVDIMSTWAWRVPSILMGIPSALSIILLYFIPESPRWMITKGDVNYAKQVFKFAHKLGDEEAEALALDIQAKIEEEKQDPRGPWKTLLIKPSKADIRRMAIIVSLALMCELGGSSVGTYYITIILQQAGITETTTLLQVNLISACWNLVVSVSGAYAFDFFGRKKQAFGSMTGSIITFILLGVFVKIFGDSTNTSGQYATVFLMFLFNAFFSFSFVPLNCMYSAEIFPMKTRAAGSTMFQFCNCAFGLIGTFILPIAMDSVGWKYYIINAGYNVIFLFCIVFLWVETKGVRLEDIEKIFEGVKIYDSQSDLESVVEVSESNSMKKA